METLRRVVQHDFHHLPQYHRAEEHRLKAMASPVHVLRRRLPDRAAATAAFGRRSPTGMERCDIGLWLRRSGGVARKDTRAGRAQFPGGAEGGAA